MNAVIRNLSILLVVQLALVSYVALRPNPLAQFDASEAFVTAPIGDAKKVQLSTKEKSLTLAKNDSGKWTVDDELQFPASTDKLQGILGFLKDAKKGWPVGQTSASQKQFKVSDKVFERKIEFLDGEKEIARIFAGDSPGFRKTYFRLDGEDNIFTLEFPSYEFSVEGKDWYDPNYLRLEDKDIQALKLNDIELRRDKEGKLGVEAETPEGKVWSQSKADALVRAASELRFTKVLGKADDAKLELGKEIFRYALNMKGKDSPSEFIVLSKEIPAEKKGETEIPAKTEYFLKAAHLPYVFELAEATVKTLQDAKLAGLYDEEKKEEPSPSATPAASGE
jgi:hypothetical protein